MRMPEQAAAVKMRGIHPLFLVNDVVKAAEYYRDVLGFRFDRYWGEPPCFCIVWRDAVEIFLKQPEDPAQAAVRPNGTAGAWDAYINVGNADALFEELRAKGAKILRVPCDAVYEMREFEVEDPDGHVLCFAHDLSGEPVRVSE
jgi:catechol 2,3-dioxygenase-like lactoylglutathione lyase family enzyme